MSDDDKQTPLLRVDDLRVEFRTRRGVASVLGGVSFDVRAGETLCVVGESGCGKSMTALALLRLIPTPGRIASGRVLFGGEDLVQAGPARMREIRGNRISMIFQEPMTSLNPVYTVGDQIGEALRLHTTLNDAQVRELTIAMLRQVGIPAPERRVHDYPHQMSGGMRQRVMIAMALACEPQILIADEPTTALDVTVQAQIFDLLRKLQADHGTAIVMITHDMGAVAEMADRVMVMYAGRVIEQGPVDQVLGRPLHPYTQGLIACLPELGSSAGQAAGERQELPEIPGMVPSIWDLGRNCAFHERCPHAMPMCRQQVPEMSPHAPPASRGPLPPRGRVSAFGRPGGTDMRDEGSAGHGVACWLYSSAPVGAPREAMA